MIAKNARIPLAEIKDTSGQTIGPTSPGFCKAACEKGSSEFCQFAIVPNDVSVGLLSLISRIAASGNTGNRVIPISDVIRDFNVTSGLDACPRSDVIVDNGKVLNSGKMCVSAIDPKRDGAPFESILSTPTNISADVVTNPGYATYSSESTAFSLNFTDTALQSDFGGWLSVTTPSRSTDVIATVHRTTTTPPCASVAPEVSARLNLHQLVGATAADPSMLTQAIGDLKRFSVKAGGKSTIASQNRYQAAYPSLGPLSDEYSSLIAVLPEAEKNELRSLRYPIAVNTMTVAVTPVQILGLLDAEICHSMIASNPEATPDKFYPEINAQERNDRELMSFRNLQAGRYLVCKFGYQSFPDGLRQALAKAADDLGRPK